MRCDAASLKLVVIKKQKKGHTSTINFV